MKAKTSFAFVLLLCASTYATEKEREKLLSGPQVGEKIAPFKVIVVKGPDEVVDTEFVEENAKGTTLIMFMHKLSEPAIGLMMNVEWYAAKHKEVTGHYVMLAADKEKAEQNARRWANFSFFANSPMSISVDGAEGPGRYGLNRNVDMTVLVAKDNKVVGNFALIGPNQTDAPEILANLAKTIGKEKPSFAKINAEMRMDRTRKRAMRMKATPIFKLAPNETLARLMLNMNRGEGLTEARAKRTAGQMREWAGNDKEKQAALKKYAKAVLDSKEVELRDFVKKQLKQLAE